MSRGWLTEAAPLIYEKCAYVSACTAVAVAQREQLRSAPHTSFVSGLSRLANGAQPPPLKILKTGRAFQGLPGVGSGRIYSVDGEGLRSVGQRGVSETNWGPTEQSGLVVTVSLAQPSMMYRTSNYKCVSKQHKAGLGDIMGH